MPPLPAATGAPCFWRWLGALGRCSLGGTVATRGLGGAPPDECCHTLVIAAPRHSRRRLSRRPSTSTGVALSPDHGRVRQKERRTRDVPPLRVERQVGTAEHAGQSTSSDAVPMMWRCVARQGHRTCDASTGTVKRRKFGCVFAGALLIVAKKCRRCVCVRVEVTRCLRPQTEVPPRRRCVSIDLLHGRSPNQSRPASTSSPPHPRSGPLPRPGPRPPAPSGANEDSHALLDGPLRDRRRLGQPVDALPALVSGVVGSTCLAPLDSSAAPHDEPLRGALVRLQARLFPDGTSGRLGGGEGRRAPGAGRVSRTDAERRARREGAERREGAAERGGEHHRNRRSEIGGGSMA